MINKKRLIKLTQKLVSIDSQNPPGNEKEIAGFVCNYLKEIGIKPKIYEFKRTRVNIVAVLKGQGKSKSLLITPHLDTVPAGRNWKYPPFKAKIVKGKLYGLGATDCKSNLACSLEAIKSIVEDKYVLNYNLIFAATADEESGSDLGLVPLLDKGILRPTQALVLDADDFDIIVAQKGLMHIKIKIAGKRAHGAYPWRGVNAIDIAINIIKEIKSHKFPYRNNKYLRPPTVNTGTIRGGDKVNVVADWCEFELDFRFLPQTRHEDLLQCIKQVIKKYVREFKIEIEGIQEPYSIDNRHPLVCSLVESMRKTGINPSIKGCEGATVITFFQKKGIPAVATGFGSGGCAHTINEYVKLANLVKGTEALGLFLRRYNISG